MTRHTDHDLMTVAQTHGWDHRTFHDALWAEMIARHGSREAAKEYVMTWVFALGYAAAGVVQPYSPEEDAVVAALGKTVKAMVAG